jgi:hypothetical protein
MVKTVDRFVSASVGKSGIDERCIHLQAPTSSRSSHN